MTPSFTKVNFFAENMPSFKLHRIAIDQTGGVLITTNGAYRKTANAAVPPNYDTVPVPNDDGPV